MSIFQGVARHTPAPAAVPQTASAATPDLTTLTNARLAEMCAERGIEAPRRATKAQLVALLEG